MTVYLLDQPAKQSIKNKNKYSGIKNRYKFNQGFSGLRPPTSSAVADYVDRRPKPEEGLAVKTPL
jgi:hypothetical protein